MWRAAFGPSRHGSARCGHGLVQDAYQIYYVKNRSFALFIVYILHCLYTFIKLSMCLLNLPTSIICVTSDGNSRLVASRITLRFEKMDIVTG